MLIMGKKKQNSCYLLVKSNARLMIMNGIKSFFKTRIGEKHLLEKNHLICSPAGEVTKTQSVDR